MKLIKLFTIAFIILLATPNNAFSQTKDSIPSLDSSKTIIIKVEGITCSVDLETISTNVKELKGVINCKAIKQGATSTFEVIFNPTIVAEQEIYAAVETTGGCENPDDRPYKVKKKKTK